MTAINWNSVRRILSDWGGDCIEDHFKNWMCECSIVHENTTAYSNELTINAERLKPRLLDIAETMTLGIEKQRDEFWIGAINTALLLHKLLNTWRCREEHISYAGLLCTRQNSDFLSVLAAVCIFKSQRTNGCTGSTPGMVLDSLCDCDGRARTGAYSTTSTSLFRCKIANWWAMQGSESRQNRCEECSWALHVGQEH